MNAENESALMKKKLKAHFPRQNIKKILFSQ